MENRTTIQVSEDIRKALRILASKRDISYQELLKDMISVFKELNKEKTIISIPKRLAERIEEKRKETDLESVSAYVTFVLRQLIGEIGERARFTEKDEKQIMSRLKSLGCL